MTAAATAAATAAPVYTLELQCPAGTLVKRAQYLSHGRAVRALAALIACCRSTPGLVVVLRDGHEITYACLREIDTAPCMTLRPGKVGLLAEGAAWLR